MRKTIAKTKKIKLGYSLIQSIGDFESSGLCGCKLTIKTIVNKDTYDVIESNLLLYRRDNLNEAIISAYEEDKI